MYQISFVIQVGSGALCFDGASDEYATFGPYNDLCITSLGDCTNGFALAFWIKFTYDCNGYLMSTRDDVGYDGIQISCHSSGLDFALMVGSSSATLPTTFTCCTWVHVVLVGKLPHSVGVAYNGNLDHTTSLTATDTYAQSTSREIVFGNQWINDEGAEFGTACIDHVIIYNTMLLPTAVENLFNSYN